MSKKLKCIVSNGEWKIIKSKKAKEDTNIQSQISEAINKRLDFNKLLTFEEKNQELQKTNVANWNNSSFLSLQSTSLSISMIKQNHLSNQSSDNKLILRDINLMDSQIAKINLVHLLVTIVDRNLKQNALFAFRHIQTQQNALQGISKIIFILEQAFNYQSQQVFLQLECVNVRKVEAIDIARLINDNLVNHLTKYKTDFIFKLKQIKSFSQIAIIIKKKEQLQKQQFIELITKKEAKPQLEIKIPGQKFQFTDSQFLKPFLEKQKQQQLLEQQKQEEVRKPIIDPPEIKVIEADEEIQQTQIQLPQIRRLSLLSIPIVQRMRPKSADDNNKAMEIKTKAVNKVKLEKAGSNMGQLKGEEILISRSMIFKFETPYLKQKSLSVDQKLQLEEEEKEKIEKEQNDLKKSQLLQKNSKWKRCQNMSSALAFNKGQTAIQKHEEPKILDIFEESFKLKKKIYKFPIALKKAKSMPLYTPKQQKQSTILFSAINKKIKEEKQIKLDQSIQKKIEEDLKSFYKQKKHQQCNSFAWFMIGYISIYFLLFILRHILIL